ncbi:MAG: hypothetical protein EON58_06940 [Alphaproteobacteria bacterium]|nr:MAG: hypothetical protein EON58_06940 [Alphaproteobacteria bacterium]
MTGTAPRIGMDRFIDIEWMELAAGAVRGEMPIDGLHDRLQMAIPSLEVRKKTIGILNRMWLPADAAARELAVAAAKLAAHGNGDRSAAFEAVAISAYPYYRQVLEHVGRLIRLQGSCSPGEVHRRMFEQHGKRTTVDQATSYAFKTLVSWGMLVRQENKRLAAQQPLRLSPSAKELLDRAANRSRDSVTPLPGCDPLLFPFALQQ